jgi:uncharacterized protein YraI
MNISSGNALTATPDFVTATLPAITAPLATQMSIPPTPMANISGVPTISPIDGTTTTQVNVRTETSTASETLGLIEQFAKVQIIGKDASGSWYQIIYADSGTGYGWVRAEYVQINSPVEIPLIEHMTGNGSGVSGLVIQKINVRNGPGTNYDSLGVLSPNDVVFITGKDPSHAWMQIEFTNAPDGKGWVASEFLKAENVDSLPVIGTVEQAAAPTSVSSLPTTKILMAQEDSDSMQAPSAVINLSALDARTLQFNGEVSSPEGDLEDWVQLTSFTTNILVEVKCSNNALSVDLWNNSLNTSAAVLACGEKRALRITPTHPYFFRIHANSENNLQYVQYSLKVSAVE